MRKLKSTFLLISVLFMGSLSLASHSESITQYIKSSAVTAKVKEKYLMDRDIKSMHISVKSENGYVILSGYVRTEAQKQKALGVALRINGVNAIKDHLIVRPYPIKQKTVSGAPGKS